MIKKRTSSLNAVLADWDESRLPNGKTKSFSVAFISKQGEFRFFKRARKAGLKANMKENDLKALVPVDLDGNETGHVYPVWIHAILYYSGNVEFSLL